VDGTRDDKQQRRPAELDDDLEQMLEQIKGTFRVYSTGRIYQEEARRPGGVITAVVSAVSKLSAQLTQVKRTWKI
jgi:hypothetical protein